MEKEQKGTGNKKQGRLENILVTIVCALLVLFLLINMTFIIKGGIDRTRPPAIFGFTPLVTVSSSMDGDNKDSFPAGSMVLMTRCKISSLKVGDVIAYRDAIENGRCVVVSHRIKKILTDADGYLSFIVKGDANSDCDREPVDEGDVFGRYVFHINKLGDFALFLQKPLGMCLFAGIPIVAFLLYNILGKLREVKRKEEEANALLAKLEMLKAEKEQQ